MIMRYFPISLAILFLCGCTEKIDIDLFESPVNLVIEGYVTNEVTQHSVILSWSSPYFNDSPPEMVRGATVTLEDSSTRYTLFENSPGIYLTDAFFAGIPGNSYTLTVTVDGKTYTAISEMPSVQPIDSIAFYESETKEKVYDIGLFAQEPPEPGDHYFWRVYKDFVLMSKNITQLEFANDDLINGNYLNGIRVQSVEARAGNRITLEMASITEEYYEYCLAIIKETLYADGPFESAPASITGNISNGALGFFTAYSLTRRSRYIGTIE
jgi:hypothetical protein